jgi:glyoxylase-like metal-dependent hydrolase (beta-lactamase superfamily II)
MKTWLLAFALLFAGMASGADYPPVSVPVKAVKLAPHSYYIPGLAGAASAGNEGFMSNAGFVVTREGVVVIDSLGSPSLAEAMLRQIRTVTRAPIKYVLVTHYHADHYYGLQVFKDAGAEIWAHEGARGVIGSEAAQLRFEQRKEILAPWIADKLQRFIEPDRWLSGDTDFSLGGIRFQIRYVGPAHSPEDLAIFVDRDRVLYTGDLVFKSRVPFVGDADSKAWLTALDKLIGFRAKILVPGHGGASSTPMSDLVLTRDYLNFVRGEMGRAVADLVPFEEAYDKTDWSKYSRMPAFREANRRNAYNTYILMEKEALAK